MNLTSAIEGGITGATTITLLQEALENINPKKPEKEEEVIKFY